MRGLGIITEWSVRERLIEKGSRSFTDFRTKASLMRHLTKIGPERAVKCLVFRKTSSIAGDKSFKEFSVCCNKRKYAPGADFKLVLKIIKFNGKNYVYNDVRRSIEDKNYFRYADKIQTLMCHIGNFGSTENNARNLVRLFQKQGYSIFDSLVSEIQIGIDKQLEEGGIPWAYWSDRCQGNRKQVIIEYFKRKGYVLPV